MAGAGGIEGESDGGVAVRVVVMQDARFALRQLRRAPGFTVAAVLTLALGIGANTAMFSVADAVLLHPLPYPHADRLVLVWNQLAKIGVNQMGLSAEDFEAFRADRQVFEKTALLREEARTLVGSGAAERVSSAAVSEGLLGMLGARVAIGRALSTEDWRPAEDRVALISHALFVSRFGADARVVGRTIRLDDGLYTVAGVLERNFVVDLGGGALDVWVPLPPVAEPRKAQFQMLALLRPGVSVAAAKAVVGATAQHLKETVHPYEGPNGEDGGYRATVVPLHSQLLGSYRAGTLILMSAVALVLLIACVNVANLVLTRAASREKEIAVRRALGASRVRLVRQWLTEAGVLAAVGGVLGAAASFAGVRILRALNPEDLPAMVHVGVSGRALLFTAGISAVVCLLFSVAPVVSVLQFSGGLRGPVRRGRMASVLIAAEVAFALTLCVGAGLLLKSFLRLEAVDTGFAPERLLTMRVDLPGARYAGARDRVRFFEALRNRIAGLPGVAAASSTDRLPVFTAGVDTRSGNPFSIDGSAWDPNAAERQIAHTGTVDVDYFRTMGVPLLRGRTFTEADRLDSQPVAVINQTLARRFFGGQDPIGKRILLGAPDPRATWLKIVGVVGDIRTGAIDLPAMPQFYAAEAQAAKAGMFLVARTKADPWIIARDAAAEVRKLDAGVPVVAIATMEEHVARTVGQPRLDTYLLAFFGVAALFLATVGIYGVVAHRVVQKTKEVGIRMALGADGARVAMAVTVDVARPVVMGLMIGVGATWFLARFLASVLYQVAPSDAGVWSGSIGVLAAVAVVACFGPAMRAIRIQPTVALRHE